MVYGDIYNLTTGCSLTSDKCDKKQPCFDNDALFTTYVFPSKKSDRRLCCFGEISWYFSSEECFAHALINIIGLIPIIFIIFVCWRIIHHIRHYFHEAVEIYQEEIDLVEVKTI